MSIITVGIDLAKNIFAVHGVNEAGKLELVKPKVARERLLPLIENAVCLCRRRPRSGRFHSFRARRMG